MAAINTTVRNRVHPAWIAAGVTFFTLVTTAGFRSTPTVLIIPLEDAFGWGRDQISLAVSVNVLLYGLTAPFAAALMERFGIRRVVLVALSAVGSGSILTIFMKSPWQLILLPGLSSLAMNHGWKSVSITVGLCSFLMLPVIALFLRKRPSDVGVLPYGAPNDWQPPAQSAIPAGRLAILSLKEASKVRDFWYLMISFFVCGLSTSGLIGTHFIPAAHDHGMGEVAAGSLLALVGVFDVIGTIFSGWLTDRYDPRKLLFFYYSLRGLSLFLLPSILFSTVHPFAPALQKIEA